MIEDTEALVCVDIRYRQQLGIKKYGTTVAGNPLAQRQWLQHAYEECLDQAVYLKRLIQEMDAETDAAKPLHVTPAERALIREVQLEWCRAMGFEYKPRSDNGNDS